MWTLGIILIFEKPLDYLVIREIQTDFFIRIDKVRQQIWIHTNLEDLKAQLINTNLKVQSKRHEKVLPFPPVMNRKTP